MGLMNWLRGGKSAPAPVEEPAPAHVAHEEPQAELLRRFEDEGERPSGGVTLFRDRRLEGPSETFTADNPDLSRSVIGARRASSIRVSPGCVAVLYQRPNYEGKSTEFREDDNNLANTPVGEDTASSIRVRCEGGRRR